MIVHKHVPTTWTLTSSHAAATPAMVAPVMSRDPFLEGLEALSHPESCGEIFNFIIPELFLFRYSEYDQKFSS